LRPYVIGVNPEASNSKCNRYPYPGKGRYGAEGRRDGSLRPRTRRRDFSLLMKRAVYVINTALPGP